MSTPPTPAPRRTSAVSPGQRQGRVDIAGTLGTVSPIATDLDMPTAVTVSRGFAWVSEGQLGRLFSGQSPNLPFSVRRVGL